MGESTKAIFLSYASQDADAARRICEALRAAGLEVWFDQSELRGGDAWDASIRKQIKECGLFVPIISANTQAREEGYFRREWNLAANRTLDMADDRAFLLPVVIDGTGDAMARVPEKFREVQWTRLPAGEAPATFAQRVHRLMSGGAATAVPLVTRATAPQAAPAVASPVAPGASSPPSIAVLPFANRSRDEEDEYFADGLADELLDLLAKIRGLRVAARTSSFQFKGKSEDLAVIGRKLNVATVLEGSLRKSGNRIRIGVQLVNVADGYHLWSETYDRTLEDIFAVQDDIAQSVVKELRSALLGTHTGHGASRDVTAEVAAAAIGRGESGEAHRLYLQGRYFVQRLSGHDFTQGIAYLRQAVSVDPGYALAWAWLAKAVALAANFGFEDVEKGYAEVHKAAEQALRLEPNLAEGHLTLAFVHMYYSWDWKSAESALRRAMEIAPGDADVLAAGGALAHMQGRLDESLALCRRAVERDPLSLSAYALHSRALRAAGHLTEAEASLRKALEMAPQRVAAHMVLSLVLLEQGRKEEALAEVMCEPADWARLCGLAVVQHALGHGAESDEALRELTAKRANDAAYQIAGAHAFRGETDAAFAWLDRAYAQRDSGVGMVKCEWVFRSLHADPRWAAFMTKMGFAD